MGACFYLITQTLGEIVVKFEMPKQFIDDINNVFDEKEATTDILSSICPCSDKPVLVTSIMKIVLDGGMVLT
jgi:hypothetical protein